MILCLLVISILSHNIIVFSTETFNYEKDMFGLGRRVMRMNPNWRYQNYESLPSSSSPYIKSPYKSLYQGVRVVNDSCVYNEKFRYGAKRIRHKIFCENVFECTITHMAIETKENKPILLRGGVGYKYFAVIVQASAGDKLSARIKAYCARSPEDF